MNLRTDLAIEAVEQFIGEANVGLGKEERNISGLKVTCIDIPKQQEEKIGKKAGRYVSIDTTSVDMLDSDALEKARQVFSEELMKMMIHKGLDAEATCLMIGLGNEHITPDALGPMVADNVMVTRHLYKLGEEYLDAEYREVSALAPGVMGMTGIETYDVIESVVGKIKPDFLIVVDALAARAVSRVNKMIQMTDTGVSPGSGVGNRRRAVDSTSLGIPVIAIGVPTVVDAVSITSDMVDLLLKHLGKSMYEGDRAYSKLLTGAPAKQNYTEEDMPSIEIREKFLGQIGILNTDEKRQLLQEVLTPSGFNMIVTPKDIDDQIESLAKLISNGLNVGLHSKVNFST